MRDKYNKETFSFITKAFRCKHMGVLQILIQLWWEMEFTFIQTHESLDNKLWHSCKSCDRHSWNKLQITNKIKIIDLQSPQTKDVFTETERNKIFTIYLLGAGQSSFGQYGVGIYENSGFFGPWNKCIYQSIGYRKLCGFNVRYQVEGKFSPSFFIQIFFQFKLDTIYIYMNA